MPTVNALGVCPQCLLGAGTGGGRGLHRPAGPQSQPLEGRESKRGILGGFPGIRSSRGGSPCLHTPVTMTIQPQPPVSMAAACPNRLVCFLFLPGLRPILPPLPATLSKSARGGAAETRGGLCVTLGRARQDKSRGIGGRNCRRKGWRFRWGKVEEWKREARSGRADGRKALSVTPSRFGLHVRGGRGAAPSHGRSGADHSKAAGRDHQPPQPARRRHPTTCGSQKGAV